MRHLILVKNVVFLKFLLLKFYGWAGWNYCNFDLGL